MQTDGQEPSGQADGTVGYPVVAEVVLQPLLRRPFRRRARTPDEIPAEPGTILVAQSHDTYEIVPRGTALTDRRLVDATALLLVSTAQRLVEATVMLPSADSHAAVEIRARFRCRVRDPIAVLEAGGMDIGPALTEYLLSYHRVRLDAVSLSINSGASWRWFQQRVIARLIAYGEIVPVPVPGLDAVLTDVAVDLRAVERTGPTLVPPIERYDAVRPPEPAPPISSQDRNRSAHLQNYHWSDPS